MANRQSVAENPSGEKNCPMRYRARVAAEKEKNKEKPIVVGS